MLYFLNVDFIIYTVVTNAFAALTLGGMGSGDGFWPPCRQFFLNARYPARDTASSRKLSLNHGIAPLSLSTIVPLPTRFVISRNRRWSLR
jgi:hypothetical protein